MYESLFKIIAISCKGYDQHMATDRSLCLLEDRKQPLKNRNRSIRVCICIRRLFKNQLTTFLQGKSICVSLQKQRESTTNLEQLSTILIHACMQKRSEGVSRWWVE